MYQPPSGNDFGTFLGERLLSPYGMRRPSVSLSVVCPSLVTLLRPTQRLKLFGNIFVSFTALGLAQFVLKLWKQSKGFLVILQVKWKGV